MAIAEIMGSRETTAAGKTTTAVKLLVSDNGSGGGSAGDYYLSESGATGRVLTKAKITPEVLPGLYLHVQEYQGFVAFA